MRFNPKARAGQGQIEDGGSGGGGGLGGGGMQLPIPTGGRGGGRMGMGSILVIIILVVIQQCSGVGPSITGGTDGSGSTAPKEKSTQACTGAEANESYDCAVDLFTTSIQDYWAKAYPDETGKPYQKIATVKFSGQTSSGCGAASSQMGPFYCPNDKRVYIDDTFMDDMLTGQLGAKGGPFALGYVLAHEYGHHIENELGILGRMRTQQGPKSDGVRVELMADCLAGVWAKNATTTKDDQGEQIITELTQDDIKRAIDAAQAVGDDRIQKKSSGRVNPEQWTHGSSEQRMRWFNTGMKQGTIKSCDTFSTDNL